MKRARSAAATMLAAGMIVASTTAATVQRSRASDRPTNTNGGVSVSLETDSTVAPGNPIHARIVIRRAQHVAGAQFTVAYDRSHVEFDGLDVPTARVALNTVEHVEGLTAGFFTPHSLNAHEATLTSDVVLAPHGPGTYGLSLRDVVVVDDSGHRFAAAVSSEATVVVASGNQRFRAPVARRGVASSSYTATQEARRDRGAAQAEWTLATEAGSCRDGACATVADVQSAPDAHVTNAVQSPTNGARAFGAKAQVGPTSYTFVVDTTSDLSDLATDGVCAISGGGCSLRAAIQEANSKTVPVAINFNIPGGGVHTLAPATRYPILTNITAPITIDGFTQPGSAPNTDPLASNAVYTIEIKGMGPGSIDAFFVTGANITFRGLDIHGFGRHIWMLGANATNNSVVGSLIGLLPDGSIDPLITLAVGKSCIVMQGGAHHNHIGIPGDANRNVVSGCAHQNIATYDNATDYNSIQNNIIGLDPTGTLRRGAKSHGVDINTWSSHTMIGGYLPSERNVSSGNYGNGIEVSHGTGTQYNMIIGNYIGTTLDGTAVAPYTVNGQVGVRLEGIQFCVAICPPDTSYQSVINNVIDNSGEAGVFVDKGTHHVTIQGNKIGVTANGGDGGNTIVGLRIEAGAFSNLVSQNEIANNDNGLQIVPTGASPPNPVESPTDFNTITQNSIHDNGLGGVSALGIDLSPLGIVNTAGTANINVNEVMLPPTLSNAKAAAVDAQTCGNCKVEVFISDRGVGYFGSGATYLASGVADSTGFVRVFVPASAQGQAVTSTATNPAGSTSEFSRNVAIPQPSIGNIPPTASFTTSCSHLTCVFSSAASSDSDGSVVRSQWVFGDGSIAEGTNVSHTYATGGVFNVSLTVTDDDAATGTANDVANAINLPPVSAYLGSCVFQLCSFDASTSTDPDGPIATYSWNFGDGATATGVTSGHTYAASGNYTVTLTVDDGNGANNTSSQVFAVTALPIGTLAFDTYTRTSVNSWGTAQIGGPYSISSAPADYSVNSGVAKIQTNAASTARLAYLPPTNVRDSDAIVDISTNKTPTGGTWGQVAGQTARHVSSALEYRLRLRFPVGGGVRISIVKVVNSSTEVQIGSEVNVPGTTYAPDQMFTTRFRVTGINPTTLQAKAWPAGTAEPGAWNVSVTDTQAELQLSAPSGLRTYLGGGTTNTPVVWSFDNYRMQVVNTPPVATFTSSCANSLCTFNSSASNDPDGTIQSYAWDFGDGTTGTGANPSHDYGSAFGPHTVTLTVTDNYTATGVMSLPINVVNLIPLPAFTVNCVDLSCTFSGATSTDLDGTIQSYAWDFGDGYTATGVSASHTYNTAEVYTIALTVTDDDGANDTATQTVTVLPPNQLPTAAFTSNCTLLSCTFDATTSTDPDGVIQTYAWTFGDGSTGTGATPAHSFGFTSNPTVTLSVTDDRLGVATVSHQLTIVGPNAAPIAQASVSCTQMNCNFASTGSNDPDGFLASYAWNFGDGTSSTATNPSHTYAIAGTWPVTLTVTDNQNATATKSIFAVVAPGAPVLVTAADTFTRTIVSGWGNADSGGAWTTSGTVAAYNVNGTVGTQKVSALGGSTGASLNGVVGSDLDVQMRLATDKAASGAGHWTNLTVRRATGINEYRVRIKMVASGVFIAAAKLAGSSTSTLIGTEVNTGLAYTPNQFYRVRAQAIGTNPTTIRAKVWLDGTSEPATWALVRTDSTAAIQVPGSVGLSTFVSATPVPVVFSIDDFMVGPSNQAPVASFTVACTGYSCTNNAAASTDDGSISSYVWSFGDGGTATGVAPVHTYAAPGSYTVTLTVTDNQGISTITTRSAVANLAPVANFMSSCTDHACTFNGTGSTDADGTIQSYAWNFGDGTTATGVTTAHTYVAAGNYVVSLTLVDNIGATGSITHGILANTAPSASFTVNCTGYSCAIDGSGSSDSDGSIATYSWDFGDGSTGSGATTNHVYGAASIETVTLTVTDNFAATAVAQHVALADLAPTAAFVQSCTAVVCSFDATTSADSDGTIASYDWNFGDGTTGSGSTPMHTYATGGTYAVVLTVTDNLGLTGSANGSVVLNASPNALFTVTCTNHDCAVDATSSNDSDGSIASYAWDFGDATTDSGVTANHTYATAGSFQITLTVTDNLGATAMVQHTVLADIAPTAAYTGSCALLSCTFDATTSSDSDGSIASYGWDFGDGTTGSGVTPNHVYATGGTHTVVLTVTDDLGLTATQSQTIVSNAAPVAAFTPTCSLMSCGFNGNASSDSDGSIATYDWNFGDGTTGSGSTANHVYAIAGVWPATLTVTDNLGATASITKLVTVTPVVLPSVFGQDAFGRTTANGWGTADLGGAWSLTGAAANFSVNGSNARISVPANNSNNGARLGSITGTDLDLTARVSFDKTQTGSGSWVNLVGRYVSANQEYRARIRFSSGNVFVGIYRVTGGTAQLIGTDVNTGLAATVNTWYRARINVSGTNPTTIKAKVWADNASEPIAWNVTQTDSSATLQAAGAAGFLAYAPGATSFPIAFSVDDVMVRPANLPPVATFVANCAATPLCTVDATGSNDDGSIASYTWVWGDGTSTTGVTSTHTYGTAGSYTVTLTVTDNLGAKTVSSQTVVVT